MTIDSVVMVSITVEINDSNLERLLAFLLTDLKLRPAEIPPLLEAATGIIRNAACPNFTRGVSTQRVMGTLEIDGLPPLRPTLSGTLAAPHWEQEENSSLAS